MALWSRQEAMDAAGVRVHVAQVRGDGAAPVEVARQGVRAVAAPTDSAQGRRHGVLQALHDVGDDPGDKGTQPVSELG